MEDRFWSLEAIACAGPACCTRAFEICEFPGPNDNFSFTIETFIFALNEVDFPFSTGSQSSQAFFLFDFGGFRGEVHLEGYGLIEV